MAKKVCEENGLKVIEKGSVDTEFMKAFENAAILSSDVKISGSPSLFGSEAESKLKTYINLDVLMHRLKNYLPECAWVGSSGAYLEGRKQYQTFCRKRDITFAQDSVYVLDEENQRLVAYLEDMHEDTGWKKMVVVMVRWFHKNEEVDSVLTRNYNHRDFLYPQDINVQCIDGISTILNLEHYETLSTEATRMGLMPFVCYGQFKVSNIQDYWKQEVMRKRTSLFVVSDNRKSRGSMGDTMGPSPITIIWTSRNCCLKLKFVKEGGNGATSLQFCCDYLLDSELAVSIAKLEDVSGNFAMEKWQLESYILELSEYARVSKAVLVNAAKRQAKEEKAKREARYCQIPAFCDVIDVPLVFRRLHKSQREMRRELGIQEDAKVVVLSFDGQTVGWPFKVEYLPDGCICLRGGIFERNFPSNFVKTARDTYTPDVIVASDRMLGKIGCGVVSETLVVMRDCRAAAELLKLEKYGATYFEVTSVDQSNTYIMALKRVIILFDLGIRREQMVVGSMVCRRIFDDRISAPRKKKFGDFHVEGLKSFEDAFPEVHKLKKVGAEQGNRHALGNIGYLITVQGVVDGKQTQISRLVIRSLCAKLMANTQIAVAGNKRVVVGGSWADNKGDKNKAPHKEVAVNPKLVEVLEISLDSGEVPAEEEKLLNNEKSTEKSSKKNASTFNSRLMARSKVAYDLNNKPKDQIVDIDVADVDGDLYDVKNAEGVYTHCKPTENEDSVHNYRDSQLELNKKMREILTDWLVQVHKLELSPDTLYLIIYLVERYLAATTTYKVEFQLVGLCSLLAVSYFEEIWVTEMHEVVSITDRTYSNQQVLVIDEQILGELEWQLKVPTAIVFLVQSPKYPRQKLMLITRYIFLYNSMFPILIIGDKDLKRRGHCYDPTEDDATNLARWKGRGKLGGIQLLAPLDRGSGKTSMKMYLKKKEVIVC